MRDNFARAVELIHAARKVSERNQVPAEIANLILVRLANVEDEEVVSAIEPRLQVSRSNLGHGGLRRGSFFAADAAEFRVVDQFGHGGMVPANGTFGILAQFELTETHCERVEEKQPPHEVLAFANNKFERLRRLNRTDDSRQHAENSSFRARRNKPGRRRLRIQAAIARPVWIAEDCYLTLEPENRTINVRFLEQDAGVVDEIARWEVVCAIDDNIVVFEQFEGIFAGQARFVAVDLDVGIQIVEALGSCFDLWPSDVSGAEQNLPLQIRKIDRIEIDQADAADSCSGEIESEWGPEAAGADAEDFRLLKLELPLHADLGHDQVAAVAQD